MTLKTPALYLTALAIAAVGPALAQSQSEQSASSQAIQGKSQATETGDASSSGTIVAKQQSSETLASTLIGMPVKNGTGEKAQEIGAIADIVLDDNQKIKGVLVGVGGFLGIGEKYVGLPWDAVHINAGTAVVDVSRKQLEQASAYMSLADQKEKRQQQRMKQNMQQQQMPATDMTTQ